LLLLLSFSFLFLTLEIGFLLGWRTLDLLLNQDFLLLCTKLLQGQHEVVRTQCQLSLVLSIGYNLADWFLSASIAQWWQRGSLLDSKRFQLSHILGKPLFNFLLIFGLECVADIDEKMHVFHVLNAERFAD
jgi:hypothetical protein